MNLSLALLCVLAPLPFVAATQLRATRFLTSVAEGLVLYIAIQVSWGVLLGKLGLAAPAWFAASAALLLMSGGAHYFRLRRSSPTRRDLAVGLSLFESFALSLIAIPFATAAWFALTIPITNFDSLAYHLPTLVQWVQSQSLAPVEFLGLQQCYPMSMMALALPSAVLGRSDIFVSLLGLLAYPLLGLSTFRLARQLGGSRRAVLAAVACLMTAPVLLRGYGNAQPDTMLAALFVFAMSQWISVMNARGGPGLLTLVLAVGLIPGFKSTGLGYSLLMSLLVLASLRGRPILAQRIKSSLRSRSGTAALLLGGFLGGFWYLRAALLCGTPIGISVLGESNATQESWTAAEVLRTTIAHGFRWSAGQDWRTAWSIVKDTVGFPFLILSVFGLVSILVHRRAGDSKIAPSSERWRPHRITTVALFGCAILYAFTPFSLDNGGHAYRLSTWSGNGVRYALPFLAIATALIAARLRSVPAATSVAVALALGGSVLGLSDELSLARTDVLAVTALAGIVAVALSRMRVNRRGGLMVVSATVVLASATVFLTLPGRDRLWLSAYGSFFQQLQSTIPRGEPVAFHGVERPYPLYGQQWSRKVVGRAHPRSDRFLWSANKSEWERDTRAWLRDLRGRGVRHLVTRSRDPRPAFDGRAADLYRLLKQDPRWRLVRESGDSSYLGLFVVDSARPANPTAESFLADPELSLVGAASGLPVKGKTSGAVLSDMDGDGLRDLLLGRHGSRVEVYLNRGELSFERAPQRTSSFALKDHHATVVSDFDHDGRDDFYFVAGAHRGLAPGPNGLYLSSDRYAEDHARTWKVEDASGRGRGGLVVDVDGDNMTELLVTNYRSALRSFAFVGESSTEHNVLEHFGRPPSVDTTTASDGPARLQEYERSDFIRHLIPADFDLDKRVDFLAFGGPPIQVLKGEVGGVRPDLSAMPPQAYIPPPLGAATGDFDGDSHPDAYLVYGEDDAASEFDRQRTNRLLLWRKDRLVSAPGFEATSLEGRGVLAAAADMNNDGRLDLVVVQADRGRNVTRVLLLLNTGDARFISSRRTRPQDFEFVGYPDGVLAADLDDDGDLDVVLLLGAIDEGQPGGGVRVLRNELAVHGWIDVRLEPQPGWSAVGARVTVQSGGRRQSRQYYPTQVGGSSFQGDLHFGLGNAKRVDRLRVEWPNGDVTEMQSLDRNRSVTVLQGEGEP